MKADARNEIENSGGWQQEGHMAAVDVGTRERGFWVAVQGALERFATWVENIGPSDEDIRTADERINSNRAAGLYDSGAAEFAVVPSDGMWGLNARAAQAEYDTFGRASYPSGQPLTERDLDVYHVRR